MRSPPLTGANRVPINSLSNSNFIYSNSNLPPVITPPNGIQSNRKSMFTRSQFGPQSSAQSAPFFNPRRPGILGRYPGPATSKSVTASCSRCLGHGHVATHCSSHLRCHPCLQFGHFSGNCKSIPRLARPSLKRTGTSNVSQPMTVGPVPQPRRFASFGDLFNHFTGITPLSPVIVPWPGP